MKVSIIYLAEKKITTPHKLVKIVLLQCYNESYFQLYFLCSLDKTIPLSLQCLRSCQLTKCPPVTTPHLPCLQLEYQNISDNSKASEACLIHTGFVLFSGLKIQGLFKDIPGRNSNFSSTPSSAEKMPLEYDTTGGPSAR